MSTCQNNPEKSSTTKINELTLSVYSLLTHCAFDATKNKIDFYFYIYSLWVKDCMKKFCKDISHISSKNFAIYAKKDLALMMIIKSIIKSETTSLHR